MSIPKPKYCGQDWLEMKPAEGGRICSKCEKTIVDFSKKKWKEIELIQQESNNTVCGMYSNKQLENWGKEVSRFNGLGRVAATASSLILMLTQLTSNEAIAQTTVEYPVEISDFSLHRADSINQSDTVNIIIKGTVWDEMGEPYPFCKIRVNNIADRTIAGAITDYDGRYHINLQLRKEELQTLRLEITEFGYEVEVVQLSSFHPEINFQDFNLTKGNEPEISVFYVPYPENARKVFRKERRQKRREERRLKRNR
ncbi:MAG: hypothetical protein QNK23_06320 [Crocinitomicaceae bacterium]|nr:hypothetical protein [Crocinitomicaceae bacterium]